MKTSRAAACVVSLVAAALLPVLVACVVGCETVGRPSVRGSGVVATEARDASGFSEVWLSGAADVTVEQTGEESVIVEADDNLLPLLEARVSDGRLTLGQRRNTSISPTRPIRYRVTVKELTAVGVSGSGKLRARNVKTRTLQADISGSGSATLDGKADDLRLSVSGSGDFDAAALASRTADVTISGSGSADVNAREKVTATVSGSGSVRYAGSPDVTKHVSGSGSVSGVHRR